MDKYHIYEEIGKGDFSQVFKGREKKKIEYVAIKRIEKSAMSKIVNEVQVMHKLNSAHVLKFYDWYETRNNLWLILEYCTGGDLESLLKQDGYLPETSVRIFGLDILAGLKYIHSLGMIHCDIKPRNFLVDEYGILKLSDFKLIQRIPEAPIGDMPLANRGSPSHMAPELFTSEGVHSFQSDFWAVGCMLYELRRGSAPFGGEDATIGQLVERIRTMEPVSSPLLAPRSKEGDKRNANIPSLSAELADLLRWLLEKAPMNRCNWAEISSHPYWSPNKPPPPLSLPEQPAFEALVRDLERSRAQQMEQASNVEYGVVGASEMSSLHHSQQQRLTHNTTTPLKLPKSESTPIRPSAPVASKQQHHQQQQHSEQKASPDRSGADQDRLGVSRADQKAMNMETSARQIDAVGSRWDDAKRDAPPSPSRNRARQPLGRDEQVVNLSFEEDSTIVAKQKRQAATSEVVSPVRPQSAQNHHQSALRVETEATPFKLHGAVVTHEESLEQADSALHRMHEYSPAALLAHSSDSQVKPIVGNKTIEVVERPGFKEGSLPFAALDVDRLQNLATSDLEMHLTLAYKALHKVTQAQTGTPTAAALLATQERINILGYMCSIASSAEVANVVLNTHFLGLVLKIMKTVPLYTAANVAAAHSSRNSATSTGAATLVSSLSAAAVTSRTLAATVLAMMLRYATFIQPPPIRARDDHIVSAVVAILKDSGRMDPRFKRRAVAALGETIFYITAQQEDDAQSADGTPSPERWLLPSSAIDMMSRCLKDDSDEVVRHYAAKTIENVFAQGGLEYRRRFTSYDTAVRLLELSLSSSGGKSSEVLQATCGMALSHMFLFLSTPNSLPPATASSELGTTGRDQLSSTRKGALGTTINATSNPDPFQHPVPVSAAKFMARVLEKGGGLSGMLETLRDGQPRLQQAFLNILNLVFAAPLRVDEYLAMRPAAGEESSVVMKKSKSSTAVKPVAAAQPTDTVGSITQSVNVALRLSRGFFLKSTSTVPVVVQLIEQGASSAVKGKALLAAQLLCKHQPSALATLGERRVPLVLVRVLEPIISQQYAVMAGLEEDQPALELSYFARTALSMMEHVRLVCELSSQTIADQLQSLADGELMGSATDDHSHHAHRTPEPSPDKSSRRKTPGGSAVPLKNTPAPSLSIADRSGFESSRLRTASELLLSAVTIASQPPLRRLLLAFDATFVSNVSRSLRLVHTVRGMSTILSGERNWDETERVLADAERSCLVALEALTQIDLIDSTYSAAPPSLSAANRNFSPSRNGQQQRELSGGMSFMPTPAGWRLFVATVATELVPVVCQLTAHRSGDVRVVVASSLRRLLPSAIRASLLGASNPHSHLTASDAEACMTDFVSRAAHMLSDHSPIPQYTVRLLADTAAISRDTALGVVQELRHSGGADVLVRILKGGAGSTGREDDESTFADPQLVVLLCALVKFPEGAALLLESDLATALSAALISAMYSSAPSSASLSAPRDDFVYVNFELAQPLVDLLQSTLHFVLQTLAASGNTSSPEKMSQAEHYRKLAGPLRAVTPALFMIFAKADRFAEHVVSFLSSRGSGAEEGDNPLWDEYRELSTVHGPLVEAAAVCLANIFDLFQEAVTNQILSRQPVTIDATIRATTSSGFSDLLSPRMVLARVLGSSMIDCRIKARLLRVAFAVAKLAASANIVSKARELLQKDPLAGVLQRCVKSAPVMHELALSGYRDGRGGTAAITADHVGFVKLALQTIEWGNKL